MRGIRTEHEGQMIRKRIEGKSYVRILGRPTLAGEPQTGLWLVSAPAAGNPHCEEPLCEDNQPTRPTAAGTQHRWHTPLERRPTLI